MLNDWILYKLSGELQIDSSNGCTSGIFDLQNRVWDNNVAKECGLTLPFSPKVNEAGTIIGTVTKGCSVLTGLREGIPVVAGGGDAQMASLGTGVVKPNQTFICGGVFGNKK